MRLSSRAELLSADVLVLINFGPSGRSRQDDLATVSYWVTGLRRSLPSILSFDGSPPIYGGYGWQAFGFVQCQVAAPGRYLVSQELAVSKRSRLH